MGRRRNVKRADEMRKARGRLNATHPTIDAEALRRVVPPYCHYLGYCVPERDTTTGASVCRHCRKDLP